MPVYQIHRLKDPQRQNFRQAPHTAGVSVVKQKDYEPAGTIEALSPYAAWEQSPKAGRPLQIGDILEAEGGALRIFKYVGVEDAEWFVPEKPAQD